MIIEIATPTLIAEGTRLQGTLTFISATKVFGIIEGEVEQQSLEPLQVGKTGWVNGSITSQGPVLVEGRVDGNIHSTTRIKLLPTAVVRGSLMAPSIEIRAGAAFEGEVEMASCRTEAAPVRAAA